MCTTRLRCGEVRELKLHIICCTSSANSIFGCVSIWQKWSIKQYLLGCGHIATPHQCNFKIKSIHISQVSYIAIIVYTYTMQHSTTNVTRMRQFFKLHIWSSQRLKLNIMRSQLTQYRSILILLKLLTKFIDSIHLLLFNQQQSIEINSNLSFT